jgi:hypothetical protein
MPRLLEISPAYPFADVEVGELFPIEIDGKNQYFHLHSRDPWKIYAVRYTRLDSVLYHIGQAIGGLFRKTGGSFVGSNIESNNHES